MHAQSELTLAAVIYGLSLLFVLATGYLGWRKIRLHRRRYSTDPDGDRGSQRKKFWGYE
jgi:hypothetical protein